MTPTAAQITTWTICVVATGGVITRPLRLPEATWAVSGAVLLVALGLLPWQLGVLSVAKGNDVYLFLIGMMLLSETARREGLFDWLAAFAVNAAKGSAFRLFTLVYLVGTVVTVFLSNDATAVVLTPAVFAATKKAKIDALPYLLVCAFVANAASFVLPISNPANLVLFGDHIPALLPWLERFALPSALSIAATYVVLRHVQRSKLISDTARDVEQPLLSKGGWAALCGIVAATAALLTVSALDVSLGLPTVILGALTLVAATVVERSSPWPAVRSVSWSIVPLVAGLFVMVDAFGRTGIVALIAEALTNLAQASDRGAALTAATVVAVGSNLINNLPAGLIARTTLVAAHASPRITDAVMVGVDLGPNLSITGSLATILWLMAIRREGESVRFWTFLKVGALVMPSALLLTLGVLVLRS